MTTIKQFVESYANGYNMHQDENMEQFKQVRDYLKDSKTREATIKELKEEGKTIKLDSARREFIALVSMTEAFYALPDRTVNLTAINYDNLKRVVRLSKYVIRNYDGDMTKVNGLGKVYETGMSSYRYNNLLEEQCKILTDAIRVETTPTVLTTEKALVMADTMTVEVKTALLERLLHDLGYSMEDVA